MSELKKCPFCGESEPFFIDEIDYRFNEDVPENLRDSFGYAVVCYECSARGSENETEQIAIAAWNKREV